MKHTPGPWMIERPDDLNEMRKIVAIPNGQPMALVRSDQNADLMAAAPEFYEAAKDLEKLMTEWGDDFKIQAQGIGCQIFAGEMIEKFKKAIAKAEGNHGHCAARES